MSEKSKKIVLAFIIGILSIITLISLYFAFTTYFKQDEALSAKSEVHSYQVYDFDNVNFKFIIATIYVDHQEIALDQLQTNEHFILSEQNKFLDVLKEAQYDIDALNLVQEKLKVGRNTLFIPVTLKESTQLNVYSLDRKMADWHFDLSKTIQDKSVLTGNTNTTEAENDVANENNSKPKEAKKEVEYSSLFEIDSSAIEIKQKDGTYLKADYPSNIRTYIVKVTYHGEKRINNAHLYFNNLKESILANPDDVRIKDITGNNVLFDTTANEGFLLFEINTSQIDIDNEPFNLQVDLGKE